MTHDDDGADLLAAYRAVAGPGADASERAWSGLARRAVAGDVVALEPEPIATQSRAWLFAAAAAALVAAVGLSIGAATLAEVKPAALEQAIDGAPETATPQPIAVPQNPVVDRDVEARAAKSIAAPAVVPESAVAPLPAEIDEPVRARSLRAKTVVRATPQTEPSIDAAEILALRRAQGMLKRDPASALAQLDAHARDYPTSSLAAERTVARITALCNTGRADAARAAADDFSTAHPSSPLLARVRSTCADVSNVQTDSPARGME